MKIVIGTIFVIYLATVFADVRNANSRIVNGVDAGRRQLSYTALVQALADDGEFFNFCTGTLITTTHALTTAWCNALHTRVIFGMLNIEELDNGHPDVQIRNVSRFLKHPLFDINSEQRASYDIQILYLVSPVTLSPAVQIAPLGVEADCEDLGFAIVSGWGHTVKTPAIHPKRLKYAIVRRITTNDCRRMYHQPARVSANVLCATATTQGTCDYDEGGPLVKASNNKLIGIVSYKSHECGQNGMVTLYASICAHRVFIYQNIA